MAAKKGYLVVRAVVAEPTDRPRFDRWYEEEHLPDAVARMKAMPTDDDCFGPGRIREDGRKLHPSDLFEVKKPEESRGQYDYYRLLQTTAGEDAFRPLAEGGCPLVRA